jgi:hypothetical protein
METTPPPGRTLDGRLRNRTARTVAFVIFGLVVAVLLIQTLHKAARPGGYDFTSYLLSARTLWHGGNPYLTDTPFPYIYPPTLAFLLGPLAFLPPRLADVVWFALNLGAVVWTVWLVVELNAPRLGVRRVASLAVPLVLLFVLLIAPIQNNLLNGQVNPVVLLLCVLFLRAHMRGSVMAATAFLGLAVAIKLVPLVFLLFLLVRRDFRAVGLAVGWTAVFLLIPVAAAGSHLFPWYRSYVHTFILERAAGTGSVYFTPAGYLTALVPVLAGRLWVSALSAFFVVLALLFLDRDVARPAADAWNFNLYLLAILLLSPMSERHHLLFLVPPAVATTLGLWLVPRWRPRGGWIAALVFWALFFAGGADKHGPFYFLAVIMLFSLAAWLGSGARVRIAEAPPRLQD